MTTIGDFEMTRHAINRALDMGVTGEEIRQCLIHPETVSKSKRHEGHNFRAGRISCAVKKMKYVITVVWSSPDGWREDIEAYGQYGGRHLP